jgi:biopolymer transport protein ExbD
MIDVTFQLLIFFLLTAQFLPPEGDLAAAVPLAQTEQSNQQPTELTITVRTPVSITPSALYTINDRTVRSSEELYQALLRYKADYPAAWKDTVVKIQRDQQARYQFYVDAYNQARRAGFEKVGLPALK